MIVIALVHKDRDSAWRISFPDLPGRDTFLLPKPRMRFCQTPQKRWH
jgi:hypothetical protein